MTTARWYNSNFIKAKGTNETEGKVGNKFNEMTCWSNVLSTVVEMKEEEQMGVEIQNYFQYNY